MKVIISPAKKMNQVTDLLDWTALPMFLPETERLLEWLGDRSYEELKSIWKCNDKIAELNFQRLQDMTDAQNPGLRRALTPAVLSYEGLQYQHMAPHVMDWDSLDWLQDHLRILSGFYGMLRPLDGIVPYRLEMQSKLTGFETESLYDFWGSKLYDALAAEEPGWILNLASKEYSRCITAYAAAPGTTGNIDTTGNTGIITKAAGPSIITCIFGQLEEEGGKAKVKEKGTLAKMARGDMVRYLAAHNIEDPEGVKGYDGLGYAFREDLSDENTLVFIQSQKSGR